MDRVFQIVAVILAGIAAYFLWMGDKDGAFVSAVLGCVAFFLSIRFQVKDRNRAREAEQDEADQRNSSEASTQEENSPPKQGREF